MLVRASASSGGGVAKKASGSFSHGRTTETVAANIGFIPDLLLVYFNDINVNIYSTEIYGDALPIAIYGGSTSGRTYAIGNTQPWNLSSFTENTITVNGTSGATVTYTWYAYKFE